MRSVLSSRSSAERTSLFAATEAVLPPNANSGCSSKEALQWPSSSRKPSGEVRQADSYKGARSRDKRRSAPRQVRG